MQIDSTLRKLRFELQRYTWRGVQKFNGSFFPVDVNNSGIGFFAHLNVAVRLLRFSEENGLKPQIRFISPNYRDPRLGQDWLPYHFNKTCSEHESRATRPAHIFKIRTHRDLGLSRPDDLSLSATRDLLTRYMVPRPEIYSEVQRFCRENRIGGSTIAVHYRGTDKSREAPRVDYTDVFSALDVYFHRNVPFENLFVASDEHQFIQAIRDRFKGISVVSLDDYLRSTDGVPVHLSKNRSGNFEIGRDALINVLVMAQCSTIVRTTSLLSSWVSIFNPNIRVILLSAAYAYARWFPERVIEKSSLFWHSEAKDFLSADEVYEGRVIQRSA